MKKIVLTLTVFLGFTTANFACQAAWNNLQHEINTYGIDTVEDMCEAWEAWVEISC